MSELAGRVDVATAQRSSISAGLLSASERRPVEWRLQWLLRVAVFCEFVGHGAFGILTKAGWVPYFGVVGISESWAWRLMPVVGTVDITLGTLALLSPRRLALAYMAAWGLWTATLRPLSGESAWELVERSYNYGVPFVFLWLYGFGRTPAEWLVPLRRMPTVDPQRAVTLDRMLRWIMTLMLLGHGAYGALVGKAALLGHYEAIGAGTAAPVLRMWIGLAEMCLAPLCLVMTHAWFFVGVFAWKLLSELLHVPAHAYGAWFEVIERGGSYAAPLLWLAMRGRVTVPRLLATRPANAAGATLVAGAE